MTDTMLLESDSEIAEHEMAGRILEDLKDDQGQESQARYGYTKEGAPRGKPGPKPGRAKARRGRPSPTRTAPSSAPRKPPPGPDYRAGVRGVMQMIAAPLAIAGMKRPVLAMDAATITLHAESMAEGAAEAAMEIPQLQMLLDRIMTVGPWGALLSPALAIGAQMMANHGLIPAGTMGTLTREEILGALHGLQAEA